MKLDVLADTRTARLIAAARAAQTAEHLPKESARSVVALSRGTRLYLEANQRTLALRCLTEIDDLLEGLTVDDAALAKAFTFLVSEVRRHLTKVEEAPATTRPTPTRR